MRLPPILPRLRPALHRRPCRPGRSGGTVSALLSALLPALLLALLLLSTPGGRGAAAVHDAQWEALQAPGLRFEYTAVDRVLAERLWPLMQADHEVVRERLRLFPEPPLRIVLAPTLEAFHALLGGAPAAGTLGVYLLGRATIVLRSPRTDLGGNWDLRPVLRHELAHGVIDLGIAQPVPLWLHEGLAILVAEELGFLDEAQLTTAAMLERLIPLPVLMARFPAGHGARSLAYQQAASFVRYLLRERGMAGLQALLTALEAGVGVRDAFLATYGAPLPTLEQRWQAALAGRFSYLGLISTTTLLGGLGLPLVLLAVLRRWWQRRAKFREWEHEEHAQRERHGQHGQPHGAAAAEAGHGPWQGTWGAPPVRLPGGNGSSSAPAVRPPGRVPPPDPGEGA